MVTPLINLVSISSCGLIQIVSEQKEMISNLVFMLL